TNIASYTNTSLSVFSREESFFQSPFHSHPEFELVYILESHGKRIIGNAVESFESGDMVFWAMIFRMFGLMMKFFIKELIV
ncbi:hypothetical protein DBR27_01250, partial [Flavobacterium sp. HMWF030]